MSKKPGTPRTNVVSLAQVREQLRLPLYRAKIQRVLTINRAALDRLHASGTLYSKEGAGLGRNLLLALEQLLRAVSVLEHLSDEGVIPAPRSASEISALYESVDNLLEQTASLTQKTGHTLALHQGE